MNTEQAFQQALALSKTYTKKSLEGAGALKGKDGFSPVVSAKEIDGGTEVSITDAAHTETFNVKNGIGVPPGGTVGQVLAKSGNGDYETEWKDPPTGTGENDVTFIKCIL